MLRDVINYDLLIKNNKFMKVFIRNFVVNRINEYKNAIKVGETYSTPKLESPNMTGTPTAPTASSGTNTTQVATTAFVTTAINNASTTIKNNVMADLPEIPTKTIVTASANNGKITVDGEDILITGLKSAAYTESADYATKESPEFTGTPTAPTAEYGTNTNQVASTAFVQNAISRYIPGVGGNVNIDHDYVVEMNKDIPTGSWYRLYKSGWLEQCAVINCAGDSTNTFTFLKEFETTNYFFNTGIYCTNNTFNGTQPIWLTARTTTGGTLHWDMWAGTAYVFACGQAANVDTTTVSDLRETIATKAYVDAAIAAITGTEDVNEEEF